MNFNSVALIPNSKPPSRLYLDDSVHDTSYGLLSGEVPIEHFLGILDNNQELLSPAHYIIAAIAKLGGAKTVEMFGGADIDKWPGNPEMYSWVFKEGIYRPEIRIVSCEDFGYIVFGPERAFRRRVKGVEDYMDGAPDREDDPDGLVPNEVIPWQ